MRTDLVEDKVKVFVSSKCGGKYTIVRKALKELLENTGIAKTYVFESSPGSSMSMPKAYLRHVDDSDLCVFLIDNEDDVSEAVQREYRRALDLDKKIICFFCDETNKGKTELEKEIIETRSHKFDYLHEFSDFPVFVYTSVINDIIEIYKFTNKIDDDVLESDEIELLLPHSKSIIKKEMFKGFDKTKSEFVKIFVSFTDAKESSSLLDELANKFIKIYLYKSDFDSDLYRKMQNEILNIQEDEFKELVTLRLKALKFYINGTLDKCIEVLEKALETSIKDQQIPNWLSNDIAIDLRNTLMIQEQPLNKFSFNNKGQLYINENDESVYFPVLDRIKHKITEDTIKQYYKLHSDSPYTTTFGGYSVGLEAIAEYFCISLIYGSITHCNCIRDYIIDTLRALCQEYSNRELFIELISMLIIQRKDKDIEKLIRTCNQQINTINHNDIEDIISTISRIPIPHHRLISECLVLKCLGNYFSDEQYVSYSSNLIKSGFEWINSENPMVDLSKYIFGFLNYNINRLDYSLIANFVAEVLSSKCKRFYDDAIELSAHINYDKVIPDIQETILKKTICYISDEKMRNELHNLSKHIIHFRKTASINLDVLDESVKVNMEKFYENKYSLVNFNLNREKYLDFIEIEVNFINKQNEIQGKDGKYIGYVGNPYGKIISILEMNNITLIWSEVKSIIDICINTLLAPKREYGAKCSSIILISYLFNKYNFKENIVSSYTGVLSNISDKVFVGRDLIQFSKDNKNITVFTLNFLFYIFKMIDSTKIIKYIIKISSMSNYEIIQCLINLNSMLCEINFDEFDDSVWQITLSLCAIMLNHNERDIRYNAIKCLTQLTHSRLRDSILPYLSTVMDEGFYTDKLAILTRLKSINTDKEDLVKYIIQKGKVDNNYLVRDCAIDAENSNESL